MPNSKNNLVGFTGHQPDLNGCYLLQRNLGFDFGVVSFLPTLCSKKCRRRETRMSAAVKRIWMAIKAQMINAGEFSVLLEGVFPPSLSCLIFSYFGMNTSSWVELGCGYHSETTEED